MPVRPLGTQESLSGWRTCVRKRGSGPRCATPLSAETTMTLEQIVEALRARPRFAPQFTAWQTLPEQPGRYEAFPPQLDPRLAHALQRRGVHRLYSHQAEAYRAVAGGGDAVIVTPTASGKTLCYNLPPIHP